MPKKKTKKKTRRAPPPKRPSRLKQFQNAHKWRIEFVKAAKKKGLSLARLTATGTRNSDVKELAKQIGVTYHTAWRFVRNDLFRLYWDDKAPTAKEQLDLANQKAKRSASNGARPISEVLLTVASKLESAAMDLRAAAHRSAMLEDVIRQAAGRA